MIAAAIPLAFVACTSEVDIHPDPSGSSSAGQGNSSSTVSTSVTTSTSSSGGYAKVVTADTDPNQIQSITVTSDNNGTPVKVLDGPFFITDAIGSSGSTGVGLFSVVTNGDCSTAQGNWVLAFGNTLGVNAAQIHGIRLPILPGQTLCSMTPGQATVLGFRPY